MVFSDSSPGHPAHLLARYQFYPSPSRSQAFSYPGRSRPKATFCFPPLSSCGGDYTWCFFQHVIPRSRLPVIPSPGVRVEYTSCLNTTELVIPSSSFRSSKQELSVILNSHNFPGPIDWHPGFFDSRWNYTIYDFFTDPNKGTRYPYSVAPRLQARALREPECPDSSSWRLVSWSVFNQVLTRFYSNRHSHPSFPYVSHDHVHLLICLSLKQSCMVIVRLEVLFVVHGFELLVRVWPMSLVLVLVVPYLIPCVSSLIFVVTLNMSFCMYHLSKRHMMCV